MNKVLTNIFLVFGVLWFYSCSKLSEKNIMPNPPNTIYIGDVLHVDQSEVSNISTGNIYII